MTRNFWSAPALALVAGLVLLVAGGAEWVTTIQTVDVGSGVSVPERGGSPGTQHAPLAVAFGLGGIVGGAVLGFVRSGIRRVAGAVVAAIGAGGLAVVVAGTIAAAGVSGRLTPAPFFALAGAAGIAVAGVAALRGVRTPPESSRYRVAEERPVDDEWSLAADDSASDAER